MESQAAPGRDVVGNISARPLGSRLDERLVCGSPFLVSGQEVPV